MSRTYGAPLQQLAAQIPHRPDGEPCRTCSLDKSADIHRWDERPARQPQPPQPQTGPWGRLLDGDDPTQRGYAEDAYQAALTGEPR